LFVAEAVGSFSEISFFFSSTTSFARFLRSSSTVEEFSSFGIKVVEAIFSVPSTGSAKASVSTDVSTLSAFLLLIAVLISLIA
jgi:hypothetical protein